MTERGANQRLGVAVLMVLGCACSASGGGYDGAGAAGGSAGSSGSGGGTSGSGGVAGTGGVLPLDASIDVDPGDGSPSDECAEATRSVYVVTADNDFYRFDPQALAFTLVGTLHCPNTGGGTPFSMSVDRKGFAWVVFTTGNLYKVDVKTADCAETEFFPNQYGFKTFGMGYSSNGAGSDQETLYVSQADLTESIQGLAKIDTSTLNLDPMDGYDQLTGRRAELTGTGDGRLYGAFEGEPYIVAEIDKSSAKILSQAPQDAINYPPSSSNFAFAFWGGDVWLFVGPGGSTDVFQYEPAGGGTSKVKTVDFEIVGAGVSTCAPLQPPK